MSFPIDRVVINDKEITMFIFLKVKSTSDLFDKLCVKIHPKEKLLKKEFNKINKILENSLYHDIEKLRLKQFIELNFCPNIVIYDEEEKLMLVISFSEDTFTIDLLDITEYRKCFIAQNNKGLKNGVKSKPLGSVKNSEEDSFTRSILEQLYDIDPGYVYDGGLYITKKLLGNNSTTGIDIDFLITVPKNQELLMFEFLKRENNYVCNKTAHPMRYCWNNRAHDNKQKFISLWETSKLLKAKLFLVNYSDNKDEDLSVIEVLKLDPLKGIQEERKINISRNEFINWLKRPNYDNKIYIKGVDYLKSLSRISNNKIKLYGSEFFNNWEANKKKYGKY